MNRPATRWLTTVFAVTRLTLRKTFFARRSLWVYLLAFAPLFLFSVHTFLAPRQETRLSQIATENRISPRALASIRTGARIEDVIAKLGNPYERFDRPRRVEGGPGNEGKLIDRALLRYTDGKMEVSLRFTDGVLDRINRQSPGSLAEDTLIFATVFQLYFLRLAVFFGCVGIFTNLFRGEMLDKSLHFFLLTPMRRETLLLGKFLSGLIATIFIFTLSATLQYVVVLARFDRATVTEFMTAQGWSHLRDYAGVTALACIAYGSVFLGAGLLFKNPIIPAAVVLVWEAANIFVPITLKKLGIIYYLQSLCPVVASPDIDLPPVIKLLISDAPPVSTTGAILSLSVITVLVIFAACFRARQLEINYGTD